MGALYLQLSRLIWLTGITSVPEGCKVTRTDVVAGATVEAFDQMAVPTTNGSLQYVDHCRFRFENAELKALKVIFPAFHVLSDWFVSTMRRNR